MADFCAHIIPLYPFSKKFHLVHSLYFYGQCILLCVLCSVWKLMKHQQRRHGKVPTQNWGWGGVLSLAMLQKVLMSDKMWQTALPSGNTVHLTHTNFFKLVLNNLLTFSTLPLHSVTLPDTEHVAFYSCLRVQMKSHLNFPVFLFSCAGMEGERPARLNRGEADRDAYRRSAAPRQYTNTSRLYSDFMRSCAVRWNEQHKVCLISINWRMVLVSGCLSNVWLLPSAGADKKAEAGAGAATEFQFVSIAVILSHQNIASWSRYACRLQPVLILFLAQGFSFGQNLSRIGKKLNWVCSVRHHFMCWSQADWCVDPLSLCCRGVALDVAEDSSLSNFHSLSVQ